MLSTIIADNANLTLLSTYLLTLAIFVCQWTNSLKRICCLKKEKPEEGKQRKAAGVTASIKAGQDPGRNGSMPHA